MNSNMKETINEKIRNQLTPMVNIIALARLYKKSTTKKEKDRCIKEIMSTIDVAEKCVNKMCEMGIDIYEKD